MARGDSTSFNPMKLMSAGANKTPNKAGLACTNHGCRDASLDGCRFHPQQLQYDNSRGYFWYGSLRPPLDLIVFCVGPF